MYRADFYHQQKNVTVPSTELHQYMKKGPVSDSPGRHHMQKFFTTNRSAGSNGKLFLWTVAAILERVCVVTLNGFYNDAHISGITFLNFAVSALISI